VPAAPTRTLVRGIRIIETLSEHHEGMRLTDLADAVDLDKATVTRLLGTLESVGYVAKDDGGPIFRLTAKILHLADCARRLARSFTWAFSKESTLFT